ncbi:DNA cytosine methyltransferase [Pseudomonas aeruginosa]
MISYGSVCSGIEAASVAWHGLGFRASWFAEIEPFPSAVLAHRWPAVKNLGDMTRISSKVLAGMIDAPDILVGGTPCQAFSVAGMREGLSDPRGALTIKYVELANAVDHVRNARGDDETVVIWENVPGVLSSKDNAFGCFLGALVGESEELQPPGGKWKDAGCVYGPKRTAAWRILDAQYFGLAQRRRRVFVIASARAGFDPCEVLFEREGMRRDHPPRRGEGQEIAGAITESTGGADENDAADGRLTVFGGNNTAGPIDVAPARNACASASGRMDFESEAFVVHGTQDPCVANDIAHTLGRNSGQENAVFAIQAGALRTNPNSGPDGVGVQANHAYTLEARAEVQAVAVALRGREHGGTIELGDNVAGCLRASSGGGDKPHALIRTAVRRLTPRECERLQGFPDDYTLIPWRGKPAEECPDGPRYKSIGNSKAVPVVRWIGRRLKAHLEKLS